MSNLGNIIKKLGATGNRGLKSMGLDIGGITKNVRDSFSLDNLQSTFLHPTAQLALDGIISKFKNKKKSSKTKVSEKKVEVMEDDDDDILEVLADYQEQSLEILKQIDENTRPDRLGDRERELEERNRLNVEKFNNRSNEAANNKNAANGIAGAITGLVGDLITGWLGAKGIGAAAGIFKSKGATTKTGGIASKIGGVRGSAGTIASTVSKATTSGISKITDLKKGLSANISGYGSKIAEKAGGLLQSAKGVGGGALKLLGTPLAVATSLYDVNEVSNDDSLSGAQKNSEYTKIGTRLAGMLAGAKAGSAMGAAGGAAGGALIGGVGAAPGAAVGGILGGIVGAIGGYKAGDVVGGVAGNAIFKPGSISADNVSLESITPQQSTESSKIKSALILDNDLPKRIQNYLNGSGSDKYEDIKDDYHSYLKSNGLKFNDVSAMAGLAGAKKINLENNSKIQSIDASFSNVKRHDPTEIIKAVASKSNSDLNISKVDSLDIGGTRRTALSSLSNELERDNVDSSKPQIVTQPVIVQQQTQAQQPQQSSNERSRLEIPASRNQDGTIQRLLNTTYKPLIG